MISWIQKTFQQHFKSVFLVLLAVVIVSFVFVTNASSGLGGSDRGHLTERMVFGYNLASNDDQARLFGDAMLSAELQSGYQLGGEELQNYGLQRAAALHVANQLHIPATTKLEVADYIKTLRIFAGQDGQFDASRYTMFRDSLKNNPGINEASVSRVLADDVRINKVQQLLGGPGYVQADDVASMLSRADTRWTIATATLDYGKYSPNIPATDAELTKFFEENTFRYEIAPRVAISVVSFPAAAYVDQVQVSETDVRAFYESNPARFPQPNADKPATDPNAAYAAVRPQVETALRFSRAQQYALKAASDFSYTLFESKVQPDSPQFEALLSAQKLSLVALAPFTHDEGPAELGRAHTVTEEAFKLGPNRRISDAVSTPAGAAILIYRDTLPTHTPTFAEVRAKVQADYVEGEKRKRFIELGRTMRAAIENRLKAGDSFEKAVAASIGSVKAETKQVEPFTLRQPPQGVDYGLLGSLDRLEKGRVSELLMTGADQAAFVYVVDKQVPDLSDTNPQYASTREQLASVNARIGASAYLSELVAAELKRTEPKL